MLSEKLCSALLPWTPSLLCFFYTCNVWAIHYHMRPFHFRDAWSGVRRWTAPALTICTCWHQKLWEPGVGNV